MIEVENNERGMVYVLYPLKNFFKKVLAFISCIVYNDYCCDVDSYEA